MDYFLVLWSPLDLKQNPVTSFMSKIEHTMETSGFSNAKKHSCLGISEVYYALPKLALKRYFTSITHCQITRHQNQIWIKIQFTSAFNKMNLNGTFTSWAYCNELQETAVTEMKVLHLQRKFPLGGKILTWDSFGIQNCHLSFHSSDDLAFS